MLKVAGLSLKDSIYARYNQAISELNDAILQPTASLKHKRKNVAELKRMVVLLEHERDAAITVLSEVATIIENHRWDGVETSGQLVNDLLREIIEQ